MSVDSIKRELANMSRAGAWGRYLEILTKHKSNFDVVQDEKTIDGVNEAVRALILAGHVSVAFFIKQTDDVEPKPWVKLKEDLVAAMIGRLVVDDNHHYIFENNLFKILKDEWGDNKAFMDAIVPIFSAAFGMCAEYDIAKKKRQREDGACSLAYGTEVLFEYVMQDFPELLEKSPMPVAMYADYVLSEMPSESDLEELGLELDGASEKEVSELAREIGLTKAFTKANILEKLREEFNAAPDPAFLTCARSNPVLWRGVVQHCVKYPDEFPCLSKKLGIVLGPQIGMTASPA
jgi:hypothetical protein